MKKENWLKQKQSIIGYKRLAKYVRDAVIYENVTYVDLKSKEELYRLYSENTDELKKIAKEIRHISRYATQISSDNIKQLTNMMYGMLKYQKTMLNLIEEKLDLELWKEVNHAKIDEIGENKQCQLQKE